MASQVSLTGTPVERSSEESLVEGREGSALWLRFNRPDQLNAFNNQLYGSIKKAVNRARYDDGIDSIVFTGTGRAYGTGGDLKETREIFENPVRWHEARDNLPFEAIRNCRKMTIAAVNGICFAGGLVTAMLSDVSIAAESATFSIPEVRVGIGESFTAELLLGRLSMAKIPYYVYTGESFSAREAERIGLITEVVPDDRLYDRVREVAAAMSKNSMAARLLYKEYINRHAPQIEWEDFLRTWRDPEAMQFLQPFLDRSSNADSAAG